MRRSQSGRAAVRGEAGMVFSTVLSVPASDRARNVMFGYSRGVKKKRKTGALLAKKLDWRNERTTTPPEAGGQQQRVAIARERWRWLPKMMLFDEPTSLWTGHAKC